MASQIFDNDIHAIITPFTEFVPSRIEEAHRFLKIFVRRFIPYWNICFPFGIRLNGEM